MARKSNKPQDWQREPARIITDRVQYWRNGTMLTAQITRDDARQAVAKGTAFVISSQAIGALDADGNFNS